MRLFLTVCVSALFPGEHGTDSQLFSWSPGIIRAWALSHLVLGEIINESGLALIHSGLVRIPGVPCYSLVPALPPTSPPLCPQYL